MTYQDFIDTLPRSLTDYITDEWVMLLNMAIPRVVMSTRRYKTITTNAGVPDVQIISGTESTSKLRFEDLPNLDFDRWSKPVDLLHSDVIPNSTILLTQSGNMEHIDGCIVFENSNVNILKYVSHTGDQYTYRLIPTFVMGNKTINNRLYFPSTKDDNVVLDYIPYVYDEDDEYMLHTALTTLLKLELRKSYYEYIDDVTDYNIMNNINEEIDREIARCKVAEINSVTPTQTKNMGLAGFNLYGL